MKKKTCIGKATFSSTKDKQDKLDDNGQDKSESKSTWNNDIMNDSNLRKSVNNDKRNTISLN